MRFTLFAKLRRQGWLALSGLMMSFALVGASASQAAEKAAVYIPTESSAPLERAGEGKPWQFIKDLAVIPPGTTVLGGLGPKFDSINGAVRLRLMGDINGLSPFPILESVVTFQEAKDADLAFIMERGRVDLLNRKEKGSATIKVTVRGKTGTVTLVEPGSRLTIEIYSRWPKGAKFTKNPKATDAPSLSLMFVATKGEVQLKGPDRTLSLNGPPGQCMMLIDDFTDVHPQIESLDKLPDWVEALEDATTKTIKGNIKKFREAAEKTSIGEALSVMAASDEPAIRRVAVILMGALDELPLLAATIAKSKHEDVFETAVIVLRHWIGREPGQDMKLYTGLIEKGKYSKVEAEAALQLLHSFGDAELSKPETYQALIQYLESERLPLRGLAAWHLVRLVHEGRKIGYQATAPKADREKAVKAWQELIPEGTVPGRPKAKP